MYIGSSLVLLAVGAILRFAVNARTSAVNIPVVGDILMIVGAVGLVLSLFLLLARRRTDVVRRQDRTTYVDPVDRGPYDTRY